MKRQIGGGPTVREINVTYSSNTGTKPGTLKLDDVWPDDRPIWEIWGKTYGLFGEFETKKTYRVISIDFMTNLRASIDLTKQSEAEIRRKQAECKRKQKIIKFGTVDDYVFTANFLGRSSCLTSCLTSTELQEVKKTWEIPPLSNSEEIKEMRKKYGVQSPQKVITIMSNLDNISKLIVHGTRTILSLEKDELAVYKALEQSRTAVDKLHTEKLNAERRLYFPQYGIESSLPLLS